MKNILFLVISVFACSTSAASLSVAFIGLEQSRSFEMTSQLERALFQKLTVNNDLSFVDPAIVQHQRDMGRLNSRFPSRAAAEQYCKLLGCKAILFGRLESVEIIPKRRLYFPLWGYYEGRMGLRLCLYDAESKAFIYNDYLFYKADFGKGYCGIESFNRHMIPSIEEKRAMSAALTSLASSEADRKMRLVTSSLQYQQRVAATPDTEAIMGEGSNDSIAAEKKDTVKKAAGAPKPPQVPKAGDTGKQEEKKK